METSKQKQNDGTVQEGNTEFGLLPEWTILTEGELARLFSKHSATVKRAVERGELPPPTRLFGKPVWSVKALREHLQHRLDESIRESTKVDHVLESEGVSRP